MLKSNPELGKFRLIKRRTVAIRTSRTYLIRGVEKKALDGSRGPPEEKPQRNM